MRVEVQRVAEALNEGDGTAGCLAVRGRNARPAADRGEDGSDEDLQHIPDQGGVVSEAVAKGKGDRQHPLPDRRLWKDPVHEVSGGIGHVASCAGRTEPSAFAGEGDDPVQAAGVAVNPKETSCQNTAIKERAQFALHETGDQAAALALPGQKGVEMSGHNAVEDAFFRPAGAILEGGFADLEALTRRYKIATLRLPLVSQNALRIGGDHTRRSTRCSSGAVA